LRGFFVHVCTLYWHIYIYLAPWPVYRIVAFALLLILWANVAGSFLRRGKHPFIFLTTTMQAVHAVNQTAIALSHGDILLSIDADCVVDVGAVEAFVQAFRDPHVMAAVGNVKIGNTKTVLGVVQALEFAFSFYFKKADSLLNTIYIIGGAAGAFRREVFKQLGGYSTKNITEDIDLSVRIQKAGMKIVYVPDAVIYTEGASTLKGLMKQRLRWKRGRFQTFFEHRDLFFSLRPQHNKLLTCVILPLALFSEVQLSCEPWFLAVLYSFSFLSGDFSAFYSGIIVVSSMFAIQAWDSREAGLGYFLLAPIGWLLFYLSTFVEIYALVISLWGMLRKKEVKWQKWQRKGAAPTVLRPGERRATEGGEVCKKERIPIRQLGGCADARPVLYYAPSSPRSSIGRAVDS
jgi:biofilm PGA synthesis N-glycosyltransferase PgaC